MIAPMTGPPAAPPPPPAPADWGAVIAAWHVVGRVQEANYEMQHWQTPTGDPQLSAAMARTVPEHYLTDLDAVLREHGHSGVANLLRLHVPTTPQGRSGDWAEILATETLRRSAAPFEIPINRLRWKDCTLPMRGDDMLGFDFGSTPYKMLKAESKGGAAISDSVVHGAREQIGKNEGMPSPHTLLFVAARLREAGRDADAGKIEKDLIEETIIPARVEHALFLTSGTADVSAALDSDTRAAAPPIRRRGFLVHVPGYQNEVTTTMAPATGTNA
jgi:hypothetical protein